LTSLERPRLAVRWYLRVARRVQPSSWEIAQDGSWFAVGGERVDLGRRRAAKRLLAALVRARVEDPGTALDKDTLIGIGWPGQRVRRDSATSRLYVAIGDLRSLGLEPVLQTHLGGYRLDPEVSISSVGAGPQSLRNS
jgi:hypothetical protein